MASVVDMPARLAATVALVALFAVSCGAPEHDARVTRLRTTTTSTTTTSTTVATTTTLLPTRIGTAKRVSRSLARPRPLKVGVDAETRDRVIAAIYAYSDWDAARMVRIASCESGLNPWAVNGKHHGIFQIANSTLGLIEEHVALAHSMWQKRGLQPWECKG